MKLIVTQEITPVLIFEKRRSWVKSKIISFTTDGEAERFIEYTNNSDSNEYAEKMKSEKVYTTGGI
ncbi:hypothetical protein [Macrococcus animalis]|uniref:hypothetical protein n=1 Tax=Macrococcus animalis TaxID=3395467 RepID=UPI0039BE2394